MIEQDLRLDIRGVSKTFGPARVLRSVDFQVLAGEVHALIGQNGCGKSTMIKILAGIEQADRGGTIVANGHPLGSPVRPSELRRAGVSIVHQDPGLIRDRSVLANIGVGDYRVKRITRRIDWAAEAEIDHRVLAQLGREIDLHADVGDLDPGRQSIVAAARAVRRLPASGGLIVFDETTKSLTAHELDDFHRALRRLVADGGSVLIVSHNLDEVLQYADRVSVLRDGDLVGAGVPTADLDEREAARMMLGRDAGTVTRRDIPLTSSGPGAHVSALSGESVHDVAFDIAAGEVLGITGVPGHGWEEIPYLLAGAARAHAGTLTVGGVDVELPTVSIAGLLDRGVALVPERRTAEGIAIGQTMAENIALPQVTRRGQWWRTGRRWVDDLVASAIITLDIRPPRPDQMVGRLSGGNQQKVLLAKWLGTAPRLLLLHEPTQAVDIGARHDILTAISEVAAEGMSVLLASVQPSDLAAVCDRVLVLKDGVIVEELVAPTAETLVHVVYADASATPDPEHGET